MALFTYQVIHGEMHLGGDFVVFWNAAGDLYAHGAHYVYELRVGAMQEILATGSYESVRQDGPFPYPPHFLLYISPLGLLPFSIAYGVWTACGIVGTLWVMSRPYYTAMWPDVMSRLGRRYVMVVALCLFMLANIIAGQTGLLVALLFLSGWMWRKDRPWLAGFMFGLLTFKPHLGLLIPIILLLEKNRQCFASATLTTGVLAAITTLLFGIDIWHDWLIHSQQFVAFIAMDISIYVGMSSLFHSLFSLGAGQAMSYAIHGVAMCVLALFIIRYYTRIQCESYRMALVMLASVMLSPYNLSHDMALWLPVWLLLMQAFIRHQHIWIWAATCVCGFMPFLVRGINEAGLPLSPFLAFGLMGCVIWFARREKDVSVECG